MHYLAQADFDDLMSLGRATASQALIANLQQAVDQQNLGVKILYVGLQDIHPPVKVAKIFEQVVGSGQVYQGKILEATANALTTNAYARGQSNQVIDEAEAMRHRSITNSVARAELFQSQMLAYAAAPGAEGVYQQHFYLDALVTSTKDARKYLVPSTNHSQIYIYNLEDKIRPDLLNDLQVSEKK